MASTPPQQQQQQQRSEDVPLEALQSRGDSESHADTSNYSSQGLVSELAPIDGGRDAWTFLAASFVFETFIWGQAYGYGAFQSYHDHDPRSALYQKASPAATAAVGTLVIAGQHFVPILTRGYFRTYPHLIKRTCVASIALSSLSLLLASFFEEYVAVLLVFQGIFYGILSGVTFTPVILWLPQWFDAKRGLASGIIYSGSGLGGTFFPLLIGKMLSSLGFAWTLRIAAVYTFVATSLAALVIKPRLPVTRPVASDNRSMTKRLLPDGLSALVTPYAGLGEAIIFCQTCAWCTISLYISTYTTSLGFSSTTANGLLSAFNAAAMIGYIPIGRLIDMASYPVIMISSALICTFSVFFLLGFSHSLPLLVTFVVVFGMSGGGFTTFLTPVSGDLARLNNQDTSTIYLSLIFIRGVAAVGGPLVGASLYDEKRTDFSLYGTNGFRGLVLFVGSGMLLTSLLAALLYIMRRRKAILQR